MSSEIFKKRSNTPVSSFKEEDAVALKATLLDEAAESNLEIVEAVRRCRRIAGMTQAEYAAATGVSLPTLSAVERGKGSPTLATINALLLPIGLQLGIVKAFDGKVSSRPWRRPNIQEIDKEVQKRQAAPKLEFNQPRKSLSIRHPARNRNVSERK